MTDILKRIADWQRRNDQIRDGTVDASRNAILSKDAFVDRIEAAPLCYGYCAVSAIPVYREVVNGGDGDSIISGVAGMEVNWNTANNRGMFGDYLDHRDTGTNGLMIQQAIICAGEIEKPLAIFVNGDSYGYDGWADNVTDDSKWRYSTHFFNIGDEAAATSLADNYSDNRDSEDKFSNLTVVTGLYHGAGRFGGSPPEVYLFVEGVKGIKLLKRDGTLEMNTDTALESHGLYGALLDYLTSAKGLGLSPLVLDYVSWSRRDRDSILHTNRKDPTPLNVRLRNLSFESDANPIEPWTFVSCPIPEKALWPCWGVIDTSQTTGSILLQFSRSCPPLKLFYRLNGKLAANVVEVFRRVDYDVVATLTDRDILSLNSNLENRKSNVRFTNYELDFVSDTVGDVEVTDTVHADLCGSVYHANRIWNEVDGRNNLSDVQITATRRFIGLEPGDVIRVRSEHMKGLICIEDTGIDENLHVLMIGKFLTVKLSSEENEKFYHRGYRGVRSGREVNLKLPDVMADQGLVNYRIDRMPDGLEFDAAKRTIRGKF